MSNQNKLFKALADILMIDVESLNDNSSSDTISNWDSQAIISLVCELEEVFGIEFDILEIAEIRNVEMIKNMLEEKGIIF